MTTKPEWALFVANLFQHGVRRIVAHPVILAEDGIRIPQFGRWQTGAEYADFEISAYLSDDLPRAWGWEIRFAPNYVDLKRAESYVRVLRRVERGIARVDRLIGPPTEFDGYLARVALTLGTDRYVVAGDGGIAFLNGSGFVFHDQDGIRDWIACQERTYATRGADT